MNLAYLVRVFWARRLIIVAATVSAFLGGVAMILTTTKAYEASSRVELEIVKPDPITGFSVSSKNAIAYMNSQIQSIRDYQVADRAVAELGWLDNPDLQQQYAALPLGSAPEFGHWVAQRIIGGTYVVPVEDSNILEIRFRGSSPEMARILSAAVRNAYVNNMSDTARDEAMANLPALNKSLEASAAKLAALQERKTALERETGLMTTSTGMDLESLKLGELAKTRPPPVFASGPSRLSTNELQLQQVDAEIENAAKSLGPNNPILQSMHRRRDAMAAMIAAQRPSDEAKKAVEARHKLLDTQLNEQAAKVLAHGRQRVEARLLQDEINNELQRYSRTDQRIVDAQRAASGGGGIVVPVGPTDGPDTPVYPNNPLVIAGSIGLGLLAGMLLAFLTEMLGRRVRTARDLQAATGSAVVVLPSVSTLRPRKFLDRVGSLRPRAFTRKLAA